MYAKIENNQIVQYPYSELQLRRHNPNVSFPSELSSDTLAAFNVFRVIVTGAPPYNAMTENVVESTPAYSDERNRWEQQWSVTSLTAEEIAQKQSALQQTIVDQTQQRLDDFARTRNYDGILSLCTYATSTVPKFQSEGQYGVEARDATFATLYTLLAEIQTGARPMPSGFADIEAELPMLVWPV